MESNKTSLLEQLDKDIKGYMNKWIEDKVTKCYDLFFNEAEECMGELALLKYHKNSFDRFEKLVIAIFLECLYREHYITKLYSVEIPSGVDNSYRNWFEDLMTDIISNQNYIKVKPSRCHTDMIIGFEEDEYIVEIKCGYTDTDKQIDKYRKATGIDKFITINGSKNSINFHAMDVLRLAEKYSRIMLVSRYWNQYNYSKCVGNLDLTFKICYQIITKLANISIIHNQDYIKLVEANINSINSLLLRDSITDLVEFLYSLGNKE